MHAKIRKYIIQGDRLLNWGAWVIAISMVAITLILVWQQWLAPDPSSAQEIETIKITPSETVINSNSVVDLPNFKAYDTVQSVSRKAELFTLIPTRSRNEVITYTVATGDSVFAISRGFGIDPESILWANYDLLNDNPDMVTAGMDLRIPPVKGVLYEWQEGDTLSAVADRFDADVEEILSWSGNQLDLTNPEFIIGQIIMIPGGHREFRQWLVPTIPRGAAGVSRALYGSGVCPGGYEGAFGSGAFIWPASNHTLSGNDYWSGHLAIDIGAGEGAPIYAADSGVVVFSGPAAGGYGNMIMIDHGNGYQTLYAHLSQVIAGCGRSVQQGQTIGIAGSTGKSTGPHLHFEVRYLGGFVSPWYVLPAP
jgi:LysM repeat protein